MAEPETLLIEGARLATSAARRLWTRTQLPRAGRVRLADVRVRLEAFLAALWDLAIEILPADPAPAPTWLACVLGRAPRHLREIEAIPCTDGVRIWLPRELDAARGLAAYPLLALEQAARIRRGTGAPAVRADRLEHDLYALAEAAAVDRLLHAELPGLRADLLAARAAARRDRPSRHHLTEVEEAVEALVCETLSRDPGAPGRVPITTAPAESREWAARAAVELRRSSGRYRGLAAVPLWGRLITTAAASPEPVRGESLTAAGARRSARLRHAPMRRETRDAEQDAHSGTWMIKPDADMEAAEDAAGMRRPRDQDGAADPEALADALSELEEVSTIRTAAPAHEVLESDAAVVERAAAPAGVRTEAAGIVYPEWDCRRGCYRPGAVIVRPGTAPCGATDWVERVMREHRALVDQVRRRFDRLRPRRIRLPEQTEGSDIDIAAYVSAFADWRADQPAVDRLYVAERPGRRDLAILLLADASASTDAWVDGRLRVIDLEKRALVVLLEALDALGDPHAALAFSGQGPRDVRVRTMKDFAEPVSPDVRRRIAALEPDDYTRTGAAIRHATALLAGQPARQRLLLMLSDGKPNDVDQYDGRYGVEDTRRAIDESRWQGILPFCLTVDRDASARLASMFGRTGYALLPRPALLPTALVDVVRQLIAG